MHSLYACCYCSLPLKPAWLPQFLCFTGAGIGEALNARVQSTSDQQPRADNLKSHPPELQGRYFMGQIGRSYIVGRGTRAPRYIYEEPSSCPKTTNYVAPCDASSGLLNPAPNPWVVLGALVRGPVNEDTLIDSRVSFQTIVQVRDGLVRSGGT